MSTTTIKGCYVVRNNDGTFYRNGQWVKEWPYEIFIPPTPDLTTCQNIATALKGELVKWEMQDEQDGQETTAI